MKLLSALLDVALLPVAVAKDVLLIHNFCEGNKSYTRQQVERVDDDLEGK